MKTLLIRQLLTRNRMPRSNSTIDKGGSNPADVILNAVLELHRKSNHFSMKKTQPKVVERIKEAIQSASKKNLEEAYSAYKAALDKAGKAPHPNYFLKVVQRIEKDLDNKSGEPYINGHLNLGKSI